MYTLIYLLLPEYFRSLENVPQKWNFFLSYTECGTMCTTRLTSAFFSFPRFFPYLESKAQPYHHTIMHWLFNSFAYKVQLKLILVYCTCFIKTVLVFTVSAERVPSKVLTHTQTHPHRHPYHDHAPTPVRCEGQTPEIRQLLGNKSC